MPARRLVATGSRVYVTLGYRAPVNVLDAATGEILRELKETALTDEVLHRDGMLVLRVRLPDSPPDKDVWSSMPQEARARVIVVDAQTGRRRWQSGPEEMAPLTLAARNGRVFYSNCQQIVCLDLKDGGELWRSRPIEGRTGPVKGAGDRSTGRLRIAPIADPRPNSPQPQHLGAPEVSCARSCVFRSGIAFSERLRNADIV